MLKLLTSCREMGGARLFLLQIHRSDVNNRLVRLLSVDRDPDVFEIATISNE